MKQDLGLLALYFPTQPSKKKKKKKKKACLLLMLKNYWNIYNSWSYYCTNHPMNQLTTVCLKETTHVSIPNKVQNID